MARCGSAEKEWVNSSSAAPPAAWNSHLRSIGGHRQLEDDVRQDLRARGGVLRRNRFCFMMADAIAAGDEDHAGRTQVGEMLGIVGGTRHQVEPGIAAVGGG